jgi:hypothetical protein
MPTWLRLILFISFTVKGIQWASSNYEEGNIILATAIVSITLAIDAWLVVDEWRRRIRKTRA